MRRRPQNSLNQLRPGPSAARHGGGDGRRLALGVVIVELQGFEQQARGLGQQGGFGRQSVGRRQAEGGGQPAHRRQAKPRRMDEGEEFEQVEGREPRATELGGGRRGVTEQRRRPGPGRERGVGVGHGPRRAAGLEPSRAARIGDQGRGVGGLFHEAFGFVAYLGRMSLTAYLA